MKAKENTGVWFSYSFRHFLRVLWTNSALSYPYACPHAPKTRSSHRPSLRLLNRNHKRAPSVWKDHLPRVEAWLSSRSSATALWSVTTSLNDHTIELALSNANTVPQRFPISTAYIGCSLGRLLQQVVKRERVCIVEQRRRRKERRMARVQHG